MNINITAKTAKTKISAVLNEAQAKCKVRTIGFADIVHAIEDVEKKIGIPKCRLDGTTITVDVHGDDFPSAYKYTPESTIFIAVNVKGKWCITDIKRDTTHRYNQRVICNLSDMAKDALLEKFERFAI